MWVALDAFLVASLGLFALLAFYAILYSPARTAAGQVPGIGGPLQGGVDWFFQNLARLFGAVAGAAAGGFSGPVGDLAGRALAFFEGLARFAEATYNADWRLLNQHLPFGLQQVLIHAEGLVSDARGYALGLVQGIEATVAAEVALAEQNLGGLVGAEASRAQQAEGAILADAGGLAAQAENRAVQLFQQAEYDAGQLAARAEQVALDLARAERAFAAAGLASLGADLGAVASAGEAALAAEAGTLGGEITAAEARAQAALAGVEAGLSKTLADLQNGLPWQLLLAITGEGESLVTTASAELASAVGRGVRDELSQAAALRAQLEPTIRGIRQGLAALQSKP
jgi:hypothetical protein